LIVDQLSIISDSVDGGGDIGRQLAGVFETRLFPRHDLPRVKPDKYTIVDVDLDDASHLADLRLWLNHRPKGGKAIFAVEHGIRRQATQAYAIGATDLVHRPIDGKALLTKFWGDFKSLAGDPSELSIANSEGIASAIGALQGIFSSACLGAPLDQAAINVAGESIVTHMETEGLASWIDIVRKHHSQTYQHSLLVTGVVVGFGRQLGLSGADQRQLSFAGLLHDIGKARIPVALLEKPGPLDRDEIRVMNQHPLFGFEALERVPGVPGEMIDMVVHHHEYLDGSGYPHGLKRNEISDPVRILTIADIFGALIERRSYKAPMSAEAAYGVLLDMGPKLDTDLVREFRAVSRLTVKPI
jgi:putative nucleotidyltransferase with HDIG domain